MASKSWFAAAPLILLIGAGGWLTLGRAHHSGRIDEERLRPMEADLQRHLYGLTWVPHKSSNVHSSVTQGAIRFLQAFTEDDGQTVCILAQEPRTKERDNYHHRIFASRAEVKAQVHGCPAYIVTGETGERRLFWNERDTAVILSAQTIPDDVMLKMADSSR